MNSWIGSLSFSITGAALLLSVIGLWFTAVIPGLDRWSRRFFRRYFIVFLLCEITGILETAFQYLNVPGAVFIVLLGLETILLALPLPMVTVYLLRCCGENARSSKLLRVVLGLLAVFVILLISVLFIDGFVTITPENQYYRGFLYPLLLSPMLAMLLLNFAGTLRRRALLSRKVFLSFIIAQVPMMAALIAQMFVDVFSFLAISYILSALAMYSFILSDQIEKDLNHQREIVRQEQEIAQQQREIAQQQREIARQQREIAHERLSVMVLQMRPHFIYNTMMSIYSLCNLDPQKARQVTMDFTNYLRRNFKAVASDSAIPFTTELEHTRAYLAVEQAQLDDMLIVEYDTPFTRFRLPPLTLQPIVENAVKHGMDPYAGPLRVLIQTRHTDDGGGGPSVTEIIVEDNGRGFDPDKLALLSAKLSPAQPGMALAESKIRTAPPDESKSHTTLTNIQQRLQMMCGGEMTITPREGGGTVVKVMIPS